MAEQDGYAALLARARDLVPGLRERAAETEALRRLPDATIADLQSTGLFHAYQPARFGGIEAPIHGFVELGAMLARGCGSTSWVFNNLASHNWMLGYWPPAAQEDVWGEDPATLIGSGLIMSGGRAGKVAGGYRLAGRWPFSSGIDAVRWVMLGGLVAPESGGQPLPHLFLVPRLDYTVIDTWHVMGLAGTGSKDVAVADAFVPEHRALAASAGLGGLHRGSAANPGPLYRLPWYPLFSFVNAGTPLGIAQGAVEQFTAAARDVVARYSGRQLAEFATVQLRLAEVATQIDAAETLMLRDCDAAMALAEADRLPALEERARWRRDGAFAAQLAARAVDLLFAAAGGGAILMTHPLQRALRDVHASNGHIGVSWDLNATVYGRVALGLAPDFAPL